MNIQAYNYPLAENIAKAVKESGKKKYAIAQVAGLGEREFSNMLNGRKIIKVCDIPKIAAALGVTPNDLYGINSKQNNEKPA